MKKLGYILIVLIFVGILFSHALLSIAPWIFLLLSLISAYYNKKEEIKISNFFIMCFIYFSFILLSVLWSEDKTRSWYLIIRKVYFVSVPISFLLFKRSGITFSFEKTFKWFCWIMFLYCFISLFEVLIYLHKTGQPLHYLFTKMFRTRFQETISFPNHHAYLGLVLNTLVFFLIFYSKKSLQQFLFLLFFLSVLYLNSSLSAFAGFIFIIIYSFLFINLKSIKVAYKALLIITATVVFFIVGNILKEGYHKKGYWESPRYRILRVFKEGDPSRMENWKSSYEVIRENFFFGTGIGDDISELQRKRNPDHYLYINKLNQHNQYLAEFTRNGLLGFIILLGLLFTLVMIKGNTHFVRIFFLLVSIGFLTENTIDRQKGVMFFLLTTAILVSDKSFLQMQKQ